MQKILWFAILLMASTTQLKAQYAKEDSTHKKFFVGSTLFMLANLIPDNNPPKMVYLNLGYRITGKDVISLEFKTWKYGWPIGIPFGKSYEAEGEGFPGTIREYGFSASYYRFFWKGLFTQIDVMPAGKLSQTKTVGRLTMAFKSLILIPLVITLNSSKIGFLYNLQSP